MGSYGSFLTLFRYYFLTLVRLNLRGISRANPGVTDCHERAGYYYLSEYGQDTGGVCRVSLHEPVL